MTFLGLVSHKKYQKWKNPTPFLSCFHFHERHESKSVNAPARSMIQAVKSFDISDDVFIHTLSNIRNLPGYILQKKSKNSNDRFNLSTFTILKENDHEISFGLTGRFWQADLGIIHQPNLESFIRFDDNTSAKLVLRFLVKEHSNGHRSLITETFAFCPTEQTKKLFTLYWLTIRVASGFIRKRMLSFIIKKFK
ncbi:hypothetical protein FE394_18060 [Xenorhabdus sp. Reich]|uniref:DUF1990 domain-containing protein n=1 Tax=Xenorhabdus littoralis TaxID=2582835 RepID=A0ABU4SQZ4_9GAMM|nr:hypothetical protein [Xenorhabdus sp. Reich]MDX8001042.1 hypothetical protein [Xenorhabdus sp. Reich]